jgi:hypothetical protein
MTNDDRGNGEKAGGSGVMRIMTMECSSKHQAQPPTNHFERLLKEACPNHTYLVKHKLRDCIMMKNFIVSRSLTRGMELDKILDEGNAMPFPREDTIMIVYDGHPLLGMRLMSNLS